VGAVAQGALGAVLATAEINGSGFIRLVFHRRESAALVAAITEWLGGAFAAGTPPVTLACFNFNGKWGFLGYNGLLV
jgi:hypothetical protein